MAKKFLTLTEQLDFLKKEKNVSYDDEDKVRLMREGYFNVITNYKAPFIIGNSEEGYTVFEKGTKLKHILALKDFDNTLRITLLEYIVKVEQEIRAVVSYLFDKYNDNGLIKWNDVKGYDPTVSPSKIQSLIKRLENDMHNNDNDDINEYINKHQIIPTWAMLHAISFSTLQIFIRDCKKEIKNELVRIYQFKDTYEAFSFELFDKSLNLLREVRNKCAHNERTYCYVDYSTTGFEEKIIYTLRNKNVLSHKDELRIINAYIYLRYYLTESEYVTFANRLNKAYDALKNKISKDCYTRVLNIMGINSKDFFKDILDVKVLKVFKF